MSDMDGMLERLVRRDRARSRPLIGPLSCSPPSCSVVIVSELVASESYSYSVGSEERLLRVSQSALRR